MAKNLRAKLPAGDTLLISDRAEGATDKFVQEAGNTGGLEVVKSTKEVAERSVCTSLVEPPMLFSLSVRLANPSLQTACSRIPTRSI